MTNTIKDLCEELYPIVGYEGLYVIDHTGTVHSLGGRRGSKKRIMRQQTSLRGYKLVCLSKGGGKSKNKQVHRLVAETFIPNPENKPSVNHIDGDPANNFVGNLEWVTHQENTTHAVNTGLFNIKGEKHPRSKLTRLDAVEILQSKGENANFLARYYKVNVRTIHDIWSGRSWKHLSVELKKERVI